MAKPIKNNFTLEEVADNLAKEVMANKKSKRVKVKTLLGNFNYKLRTEEIASKITDLLFERNILLNPSIMKFGNSWALKRDDSVYLILKDENKIDDFTTDDNIAVYDWKQDNWFQEIKSRELRNEKEVETKFVIPLLERLGYHEDDRYDGMPVSATVGSKHSVIEVDFGIFNSNDEELKSIVLLMVEVKNNQLNNKVELDKAQKQLKSYSIHRNCYFGLLIDRNIIQVIDIFPTVKDLKIIFKSTREELYDSFGDLYGFISKVSITKFYKKIINN